ncbi:hypothetical protein EZI54_12095 [Marinobacter halodurans]|uniref:LPXTG cell wall anchor domain-containing protein n=1 Tax=Marinobacter halodurans TaxID=2528979 RepID=A0ABY1ZLG1_9GAMM|nr:DUF308 domain-containing protein [Marinobacter halodurans]TBW55189.1 hypothetical protein EZI54_12095 [Marinobacter halodurans]
MDNPKKVVTEEPRKSLIVLFLSAVFSIIVGIVALMAPGAENTDMAENVGWVMILVGLGALVFYIIGRKEQHRP